MASDKIKVAVRVRPFNRRELELGTQCVVEMEGQQTVLQYPQSAHDKESESVLKSRQINYAEESGVVYRSVGIVARVALTACVTILNAALH
ncbi:Kinesin-like protein KIF13A [Papilio machaon]|uniref:Kinesin-like protein KIF13A n=1 Tax=Papilio machaon TaxID=76193 RepID=A0A0N0PAL5_PAPMA|nr:Kinesin-like protein KIF13A [Papilio machaon]